MDNYCVDIKITHPTDQELPPSLLFDVCKALFSIEAVGWVSWKQEEHPRKTELL